MKPTTVLKQEHRAVERVLRVLNRAADRLDEGKDVSPAIFEDSLDFLRNFADKCHHGKEEELLFPAMEKAGVRKDRGPIGVMLVEHEQGRQYIQAMVDALEEYRQGNQAARATLADNARAYAALLSQHIQKEDQVLFPMAEQVLAAEEEEALVEGFDRIEQEHIGPGVHERYHQMIDQLEEETATA
jgi:hemerythrin-like domain-containing protein